MERLVDFIVIVTSIILVTQVIVLVGILLAVRRMTGNIDRLRNNLETKIDPALEDFRGLVGDTRKVLVNAEIISGNFAQVSENVRTQIQRVNDIIEETAERARLQIAKVDNVVSDAVEKMQATSDILHESVISPVRELSALVAGISSGLQFLFSRRKNHVNEVHQDEELFI